MKAMAALAISQIDYHRPVTEPVMPMVCLFLDGGRPDFTGERVEDLCVK